jgi:hypothetical protein
MLYGIGVMVLLLSLAFTGGSIVVPVTMTLIGVGLMRLGRRFDNGKKTNTAR